MRPGNLQVHAVPEGQVPTQRYLRVYREVEDRHGETATRIEADPRAAEACAENQGARIVLGPRPT